MTDFLTMLRANNWRTWAETSYRPGTYPKQNPFKDEELTPVEQETRLAAIRARVTIQIGMPIPDLMNAVKESKFAAAQFSHFELAAIADRCYRDTPLADTTIIKLKRVFRPEQWPDMAERLNLK